MPILGKRRRKLQAWTPKRKSRKVAKKASRPYKPAPLSNYINPANLVTMPGYGFPDVLRMRMSYGDTVLLTSSTTTLTPSQAYRMTSTWDPDYTGAGGQPYWRDQIAGLYGRYRVIGSKITVTFAKQTESSTGNGPHLVGIQMSNASALSSINSSTLITTPDTNTATLSQDGGPVTLTCTYSPSQAFGPHYANSDDLQAAIGSNPTRNWLATIFACNNGTASTTNVIAYVKLEFMCEFSDLQLNSGS